MNNITASGRLTADPIINYTQNNKPVANFSIADNGRNDKPLFIKCTCLNERQATFAQQYLSKGTKVIVTGRLESDDYTDKNGQLVHNTVLMVNTIEFAESKPQNNQQNGQNQQQTQPVQNQNGPFQQPGQYAQNPNMNGMMQQPVANNNPMMNTPGMPGMNGPVSGMPTVNQPVGMQGNPMAAMPPVSGQGNPMMANAGGQGGFGSMYDPNLPFN